MPAFTSIFGFIKNQIWYGNSIDAFFQVREKSLENQIDRLESAGVPAGDREGHLVTVQELLQTVKGFKDVPDSSRLERIGQI